MIIILLLEKLARIILVKTVSLLPKIAKKELETIYFYRFEQLWEEITVFIKFISAILCQSRKMIIDCQLNSLQENCLKTPS